MVIQVSVVTMAMNTPVVPMFSTLESNRAKGIWKTQNQNKLIQVGVLLSPAPLKALIMTIPTP